MHMLGTVDTKLPFQRFLFTLPVSMSEFLSMRDQRAITPEGGALMFIIALLLISRCTHAKSPSSSSFTPSSLSSCLSMCIHPDQLTAQSSVDAAHTFAHTLCDMDAQHVQDVFDKQPCIGELYNNAWLYNSADVSESKVDDDASTSSSVMSVGVGDCGVEIARHPFIGTASGDSSFSLLMINSAGNKFPRSMKVRKDVAGLWRYAMHKHAHTTMPAACAHVYSCVCSCMY